VTNSNVRKPKVAAPPKDAMALINICGSLSPLHQESKPTVQPPTSAAAMMIAVHTSRAERLVVTLGSHRRTSERRKSSC